MVLMAHGTKVIMKPACSWRNDKSLVVSLRGPTGTIIMGSADARDEYMPVSMIVAIMEVRYRVPRFSSRQSLKRGGNQVWTDEGHATINHPNCASNLGAIGCLSPAATGTHKNTLAQFHAFLC